MHIVIGTRPYFRKNQVAQFGVCAFCNRYAKLVSFTAKTYLHVYFLPLFPTQPAERMHKQCTRCSKGMSFTPDLMDGIVVSMKSRAADVVAALQHGESKLEQDTDEEEAFEPYSEEGLGVDCITTMMHSFDWLFASGEVAFCEAVASQLERANCLYASRMANAYLASMRGNLDVAIRLYQEAGELDKRAIAPLQLGGSWLVQRQRFSEAIDTFYAALSRATSEHEELAILLPLSDLLWKTKKHAELVAVDKRILVLRPNMADQVDWMKRLSKAKRKSGLVE